MDTAATNRPVDDEAKDPFKRRVALLIAGVTFFGSVVAFLNSQASAKGAPYVRESQRSSVDGFNSRIAASAEEGLAFSIYDESQRYHRRGVLAAQRARSVEGTPQSEFYAAEAQRFAKAELSQAALTPLLASPALSRQQDPAFPTRYRSEQFRSTDGAQLRQASFSELGGKWGDKGDAYVRVLTLLATSLFLLGLSLTINHVRTLLVVPGVAIAVACVISTFATASRSPSATPGEAIAQVVEGDVRLSQSDYEGAIDHYRQALQLHADYGQAHGRLAAAYLLAGSPEAATGGIAIVDDDAARRSVEHGEQARRLGAGPDTPFVLSNLGASYFQLGRYETAEKMASQAVDLDEGLPEAWLNLGAFRAAQGDDDGAHRAYVDAIARVDARPDEGERRWLYGSGRTDLELIALKQPGRRQLVIELQELLTVAETASTFGSPVGRSPAAGEISAPVLQPDGPSIVARFQFAKLTQGDKLAFIWYSRSNPDRPWSAQPDMSSFEAWDGPEAGTHEHRPRPPSRCATSGQFRLDVYLEGRLLHSTPTEIDPGALGVLVPYDNEVLGLEVCRPERWTVRASDDDVSFSAPSGALSFIVGTRFEDPNRLAMRPQAELDEIQRRAGSASPSPDALFGENPLAQTGGQFRFFIDGAREPDPLLVVAASLGRDGVMRTLVIRAPLRPTGPEQYISLLEDVVPTLSFRDLE